MWEVVVYPRVDDTRTDAPPDWIADVDRVVRHDIGTLLDGGTFGLVVHLDGRARETVVPVEVGGGVMLCWLNLPGRGMEVVGEALGGGTGVARGGEIDDECLGVVLREGKRRKREQEE